MPSSTRADPSVWRTEAWGIDFEAEVAVITGDVPMGASLSRRRATPSASSCWSTMSRCAVSFRRNSRKGFGFFQGKPSSAFSPVAVTPDELGAAWDGAKLHLPMRVDLNGSPFGRAEAGEDMTFDFPTLIAHAAKTRPLSAGSIIGSGTISNKDADGSPGRPVAQERQGLFLHRRNPHDRDHPRRVRRRPPSCASATRCASRCWTPRAGRSSATIEQTVEPYKGA